MQAGAFSQRQDGLVVVVHIAAKGFAVEQEHQVASVDGVQKVELHSNKEDAHSVVLQGQSKKSRQQHQGSSTQRGLAREEGRANKAAATVQLNMRGHVKASQ